MSNGYATTQDSINFKTDAGHVSEFFESSLDTLTTRLGASRLTHTGLMKLIFDGFNRAGGVPVGDGMWSAGKVFARHDEYLIHGGKRYRLKASTPTPYSVGATPDLIKVEEAPPITLGDLNTSTVTTIGTSVARSLAERFKDFTNLKDYGAVGDGDTDDTNAFKNAALVGGHIRGWPGAKFKITQPVKFKRHGTFLDLRGTEVIWDNVNYDNGSRVTKRGTATGGGGAFSNRRYDAIFMFEGERVGDTLTYNDCMIDPDDTASTYATIDNVTNTHQRFSDKITITGRIDASITKQVWIQWTRADWTKGAVGPKYSMFSQVKSVSYDSNSNKTVLRLNQELPAAFTGKISIAVRKPLINCSIAFGQLKDISSSNNDYYYTKRTNQPVRTVRVSTNAVSGVTCNNTVGFRSTSVQMKDNYNPVFNCTGNYDIVIDGGSNVDPKAVSGGRGYYVQFGSSSRCVALNCSNHSGRHVVDFTACFHVVAFNCHGTGLHETAISLHGQWEYDVLIDSCTGTIGLCISGTDWFGNTGQNITVRNCRGKSLFSYGYARHVRIENCDFTYGQLRSLDVDVVNSKFHDYVRIFGPNHAYNTKYGTPATVRDAGVENRLKFVNCNIRFEEHDQSSNLAELANVEFHLCDVDFRLLGKNSSGGAKVSSMSRIGSFKMNGGVFRWGYRIIYGGIGEETGAPTTQPNAQNAPTTYDKTTRAVIPTEWILNNVDVRGTFVLGQQLFAGFRLILNNCFTTKEHMSDAGVIRNQIEAEGITAKQRWYKDGSYWKAIPEDTALSVSAKATIVVNGGYYAAKNGSQKVFDFNAADKCLNVALNAPTIDTYEGAPSGATNFGQLILLTQTPSANRGTISVNAPIALNHTVIKYLVENNGAFSGKFKDWDLDTPQPLINLVRGKSKEGDEIAEFTWRLNSGSASSAEISALGYSNGNKKIGHITLRSASVNTLEITVSSYWSGNGTDSGIYRKVYRSYESGGVTNWATQGWRVMV